MRRGPGLVLASLMACIVSFALGCMFVMFTLAHTTTSGDLWTSNAPLHMKKELSQLGSEASPARRQLLEGSFVPNPEDQPPRKREESEEEHLKWKLLEPPLVDEVQRMLESHDKWWKRKLEEQAHKWKLEREQQQLQPQQNNHDASPRATGRIPFDPNFLGRYKGEFSRAMEPISSYVTTKEKVLELQQTLQSTHPIVYFITPTAHRRTQMADLTRLGQTLLLDQYQQQQSTSGGGGLIYWVLIEDALRCTKRLRHFLKRLNIPFAHVAVRTPPNTKNKTLPPRGVEQRNYAMDLVQNRVGIAPGIVYFGDDDNVYDVRLFNELRKIKRIGVLPVGYRGGGHYERCIVNPDTGMVDSIVEKIPTRRKYPVDMAGLAYHSSLLWSSSSKNGDNRPATFSHDWSNGQQETRFLQQLVDSVQELEPLAYNCTHFFVWHLSTTQPDSALKVVDDPDYDSLRHMV